ncbi:MAG TPA: DNA cytosine methyltransferase [Candidatus Acidoferrum sp.]|nr:DNA cytosine methyltransferase [Candidatus Acidoferrum sp.]
MLLPLTTKIPLLSFFTGGGFLDIGFEQAGFEVPWSNECNPEFAAIYAAGVTSWRRSANRKAEAAKVSSIKSIAELKAEDILKQAFPGKVPELFGVVGGPPCSDFSAGGLHAGHNGENGQLTEVYVNMLKALNPSFFLLENVPHLESHPKHGPIFKTLLEKLDTAGYAFVSTKLNSLEFGVPQDRTRLFVVGFRRDLLRSWYPNEPFPKRALETHFKWPTPTYPNAKAQFTWPGKSPFRGKPGKPEAIPVELCVCSALAPNPVTFPNGKEWFKPKSKKFKTIQEGDVSGKSFKRLHRFRYSPTAWYGNNEVHLHPTKARRLSVREALRLQTVPDSYIMPADSTLSAKFKVICNGVPFLLATKIAEQIADFISFSAKNRDPSRNGAGTHNNGR